jgi:CRISPR-associated protein Cas5d
MRVRGAFACFTCPAFKVERVSYDVITPSAARGIFEAVLWKPAIRWQIHRIIVLSPIQRISFRTNELTRGMTWPGGSAAAARQIVDEGGEIKPFISNEHRTQRNTLALRDVDYILEASIEMTSVAGPRDNHTKFAEMFRRRLHIGQHFQMPYLGIREFVADVEPVDWNTPFPPPIALTRNLGWMIYDIDYRPTPKKAYVFKARMNQGVIDVPPRSEVIPLGAQHDIAAATPTSD